MTSGEIAILIGAFASAVAAIGGLYWTSRERRSVERRQAEERRKEEERKQLEASGHVLDAYPQLFIEARTLISQLRDEKDAIKVACAREVEALREQHDRERADWRAERLRWVEERERERAEHLAERARWVQEREQQRQEFEEVLRSVIEARGVPTLGESG